MKTFAAIVLTTLSLLAPAVAAEKRELWLYYATNLQVDQNVDQLEKIWRRAAAAGYTRVMLTDSKFARLGDLGSAETRYFQNVERVKKIAQSAGITVVPALFSIGWSNNMLWHNPNLTEGLPVKDAPFVVKDGHLVAVTEPTVSLGKPGEIGLPRAIALLPSLPSVETRLSPLRPVRAIRHV